MNLPTLVVHPADTQVAEMTRPTETEEGETRETTVIVIETRSATIGSMEETGKESVTETGAVTEEARVENDIESLLPGGTTNLLCRRGEVVEEEKVGPIYLRLCLPRHRCMGRMIDGALDPELDKRKDHVEVMAGDTMTARTPVAVVEVEVEMMTCHQGNTQEATKGHHMAVAEEAGGEAGGWQAKARGLAEGCDRNWSIGGPSHFSRRVLIRMDWHCLRCTLGMLRGRFWFAVPR
jgi:hypothetical protein